MAHCPSSNVLNAVGAPKSCSLLGEGAGAVQNEEIHSTRMPEFTEMLPTQLSSLPSSHPKDILALHSPLPHLWKPQSLLQTLSYPSGLLPVWIRRR